MNVQEPINDDQQEASQPQDIQELILHLQDLVSLNLKNLCLDNAIFFSEKIMILTQKRMNQINALESDSIEKEGEDGELTHLQKVNYDKHFAHNQYIQSIYTLAFCFLQNREYSRCVNIVEKHDLVYSHEKFRVLVGQAHIYSG